MRCQKHGNGHVIQPMRRHGIFRIQYTVEVLCVPVIPDEGVCGKIDDDFGRIAFMKWSMQIWINNDGACIHGWQGRSSGVQPRLEEEGQSQSATRPEISPCIEFFITLRDNDTSKYCNPNGGVTPCEYLVAVFAWLGDWIGKLQRQWQ